VQGVGIRVLWFWGLGLVFTVYGLGYKVWDFGSGI
jgi:hypothetical protein